MEQGWRGWRCEGEGARWGPLKGLMRVKGQMGPPQGSDEGEGADGAPSRGLMMGPDGAPFRALMDLQHSADVLPVFL